MTTYILTAAQMAQADKLASAAGISEMQLIRTAGKRLAEKTMELSPIRQGKIIVCCGGGNNGADGYICAGHLLCAGYEVQIISLVDSNKLTGERAQAAQETLKLLPAQAIHHNPRDPSLILSGASIILDALFGTGLNRAPTGPAARLITAINAANALRIAVDIPSGLGADQADPLGEEAVRAHATITFFLPKLAHYLEPAATHCGKVHCVPIGIPTTVLDRIKPSYRLNTAKLLRLPTPKAHDHKYSRGHALILAGEEFHGAGALCAAATQRAGAGLTSLISSAKNASLMRTLLPASCIVRTTRKIEGIAQQYKANAALIGSGSGVTAQTARQTLQLLAEPIPILLDADALTAFRGQAELLLETLTQRDAESVLTPHYGEFSRLFSHRSGQNRLEQALTAAQQSQSILVLKGADTVIASPDGQAVINPTASPYLASGGSGDVLGGIILGLLAQGMTAMDAACAGVYIHSQAAERAGINLIPEDLITALPAVYGELLANHSSSD